MYKSISCRATLRVSLVRCSLSLTVNRCGLIRSTPIWIGLLNPSSAKNVPADVTQKLLSYTQVFSLCKSQLLGEERAQLCFRTKYQRWRKKSRNNSTYIYYVVRFYTTLSLSFLFFFALLQMMYQNAKIWITGFDIQRNFFACCEVDSSASQFFYTLSSRIIIIFFTLSHLDGVSVFCELFPIL